VQSRQRERERERELAAHFEISVPTCPPDDLHLHVLDRGVVILVSFHVFTAVTMKNGVFWDVTSCGSCKNRRFGGT
jgi:hypothetical protein